MSQPILLKKQPNVWLLAGLAISVLVINSVDALATLYWIRLGVEEANPFMAYILEYNTTLFIAIKALGVTAAIVLLLHFAKRRYAIAFYGLILLLVVYLYPLFVHIFLYCYTSFK